MRLFGWPLAGEVLPVEADLPYLHTSETECRFIGASGRELARRRGCRREYRLVGDEPYVRVEARNDDGSTLWTQPLLLTDRFDVPE